MKLAVLSLLFASVASAQNVVVLPPSPDYVGDFAKSQQAAAERKRQREHELKMQREWLAAQQAMQQSAPSAQQAAPTNLAELGAALDECANSIPPLRETSITRGALNGRFWKTMTASQRFFYLQGMVETLRETQPKNIEAYSCECTFGEITRGITEFYGSDTTFEAIPITFAAMMYAAKAKGEEPELIASRARGYLKYLALSVKMEPADVR